MLRQSGYVRLGVYQSVFRHDRTHVEVIVQADAGDNASVFEMRRENSIRRRTGCARDNGTICGEGVIAKIVIKRLAFNRQLAKPHLSPAAGRPTEQRR
jgi:hypothetical protein